MLYRVAMKGQFKIYKGSSIRYKNNIINNSYNIALKILAIFIFFLAASIAYSASVTNSKHDLSYLLTVDPSMANAYNQYGEVCVYCHTPHGANTGITAPLWNRNTPVGPFNVYTSDTMDTVPSNPPSGISLACLSCHDGTTAVDSIINAPGSGANLSGPWYSNAEATSHYKMSRATLAGRCAFCHGGVGPYQPGAGDHRPAYLNENLAPSGTPVNLSNDHPISMAYPSDQPTQFNSAANGKVGTLPLYGGKVECSSCHNVHNPANIPFLRSSNSVSAICTTCHKK